jgi:hypothetical protein
MRKRQLLNVAAIGLTAILALNSCSSLKYNRHSYFPESVTIDNPQETNAANAQISVKTIIPPIESVPFQEFNPEPYNGNISLDPLYEEYITGKNDLQGIIDSTNLFVSFKNLVLPRTRYPFNVEFKIPQEEYFRKEETKDEVFAIARNLGYDNEVIKNLTIQEAILLSGLVTTKKMDVLKEEDRSEQNIRRIYQKSIDDIFTEGFGVCGHYAEVNMAVFNLFKSINPRLKNTIMKYKVDKRPKDKERHAWNEIITLTFDTKLKFLQTAVDTLQLENSKPEGSLNYKCQVLNAMGPNVYYTDLFYMHKDLAELYEKLGSTSRPVYASALPQKDLQDDYLYLAFQSRLQCSYAIFDILKESSRTKLDIMITGRSDAYIAELMPKLSNYSYVQLLMQKYQPEVYESYLQILNLNFVKLIEDVAEGSGFKLPNSPGKMEGMMDKLSNVEMIYNQALEKNMLDAASIQLYHKLGKVCVF